MRHAADEGLQMAYNTNYPPKVKAGFRHIMGMSMLPFSLIERAWASLRQPPPVEDSSIFDNMKAFALYFERTWISGSYPPTLWTHFDNCGSRTTNVAEGWHNSLSFRHAASFHVQYHALVAEVPVRGTVPLTPTSRRTSNQATFSCLRTVRPQNSTKSRKFDEVLLTVSSMILEIQSAFLSSHD